MDGGLTKLWQQQFGWTFFSRKQNKDDHVIKTGNMIGNQKSGVNIEHSASNRKV